MNFVFYIIAIVVLSPLIALGVQSFGHESETFSFLVGSVLDDVVFNSLAIAFITGSGVLIVGVSCAWFTVHYRFFGRGVLNWMLFLPLAFPAYILAYIYTNFFDAAGSLANDLRVYDLDWILPDVRTIWGASFILTFCLYPYVYLFARNGFLSGSKSQIECGQMLGAGRLSQFFYIALPSARPFILVGLMLVIMEVLADYGTMDYFGLRVFSTVIYDSWAGYGDITAAARLSLLLLSFVLLLVWTEKKQRQKMRFYALETGGAKGSTEKGSIIISMFCTLPVLIGFVFPAVLLLKMVFETLDYLYISQHIVDTLPYLLNSLIVCFIVAFFGVTISYFLASLKRLKDNSFINSLYTFCGFGYALPGIILGLGLLLVSALFTQISVLITGTFLFLIVGYLIRFLNVSLQSLEAGYEAISPSIDQASTMMQHSKFDDFWRIKLPLLAPALFSAALILSVEVIKELPLTLVLRPFDFDTLAVRTYNLASDERLADAAFPALFIVMAGCVPILFLQKFVRSPV